jgi:hypothetical protein
MPKRSASAGTTAAPQNVMESFPESNSGNATLHWPVAWKCSRTKWSTASLLLRPLIFRPLIHPVVHGFVPELRVLRLQYPVAFVGEVQHL